MKGKGYDDEKGKGNAEKGKGNDETYTTPWESKRSRNAAAAMRAPDGKVTQWEKEVLDTPMMIFILEYVYTELEGYPDAFRLLRCSSTLSGRRLGENKKPVFHRLNNFREYNLDLQFDEGGWSSEYYFPTP